MSGTSRESDKFMLRLPEGMRERVKASAEANNRSMNSEVVRAIEHYLNRPRFEIDTGPPSDPEADELDALEREDLNVSFVMSEEDIDAAVNDIADRLKRKMAKQLMMFLHEKK